MKLPKFLSRLLGKSDRKKQKARKRTKVKPALNDLDNLLAPYLDFDNGFFIECGANDGYAQSNTFYLESQKGWRGLLVEGIPTLYEKCVVNRPHSIVKNCALVSRDYTADTVTMHYCNLMSMVEGSMKSSDLQTEHLNAGLAVQKIDESYSVDVKALTLESVLDSLGEVPKIDFFSLDVEGYELEVLKGLNLARYRPTYILVEARFYDEISNFMSANQYREVAKLTSHDYLFKDSAGEA